MIQNLMGVLLDGLVNGSELDARQSAGEQRWAEFQFQISFGTAGDCGREPVII